MQEGYDSGLVRESNRPKSRFRAVLRAITATHRIKATTGYNVAYFLIFAALIQTQLTLTSTTQITMLFAAVFLLKTQASLADVIHDFEVDRENPEKSVLANAVSELGQANIWTMLNVELTISLVLWGVLSLQTNNIGFLLLGGIGVITGFVYSYPPRIKERGVWNHVTTTAADVLFILAPVYWLFPGTIPQNTHVVLITVFLFTFGYHILHQAADTYYDAQTGVNTFTRSKGVPDSVRISIGLFLLSGSVAFLHSMFTAAAVLVGASLWLTLLLSAMKGTTRKQQTDIIASKFDIAWWASAINTAVAISIYIHGLTPVY